MVRDEQGKIGRYMGRGKKWSGIHKPLEKKIENGLTLLGGHFH